MSTFEYYKNIIVMGVILSLLIGGGTTIYLKYKSLTDTIADRDKTIEANGVVLQNYKDKLSVEKSNNALLKTELRELNDANQRLTVDLELTREAYNEIIIMSNEERYGKDSNITKVLEGNDDLHNTIRKISGIKYEDL